MLSLAYPFQYPDVKRSFTANCGTEPADTYYIVAYTTEDDGWNKKGAGTLKMP